MAECCERLVSAGDGVLLCWLVVVWCLSVAVEGKGGKRRCRGLEKKKREGRKRLGLVKK